MVERRNREVATFDAWTVAFVAAFHVLVGHPRALLGEDLEHRAGDVGLELHFVEDEELRLRAHEYGVTDAGGLEEFLGAAGDGARVAVVALHGARLDDVADQDQGRLFGERVQHGGAVVRQQDHVGSFDALPAFDGGAVEHLAVFEEIVIGVTGRHGHVLLLAFGIGEAQINPLHVVFFNQLKRLRHVVLQVVGGSNLASQKFGLKPERDSPPGRPASQGSKLRASAPEWTGALKLAPGGGYALIVRSFAHRFRARYGARDPFWCIAICPE
ncbi:hypothetical protein D3C80_1053430 [compost metagenome]